MNIAVTYPGEDLPRRAFDAEDVRRMVEAGVIDERERIELIGGELIVMAAKGFAHERIKIALNMAMVPAAPPGVVVAVESTLQLADDTLVETDIAVLAQSAYRGETRSFVRPNPEEFLLVVEIAASSIAYDRGLKARLYARHGIREFWVIDANARTTWIYTGPRGEDWSSIIERGSDDALVTPVLQGFTFRLADLD